MSDSEHHRLSPHTLTAVATGEVEPSDVALLASARRSRLLLALTGTFAPPYAAALPDDRPRTNPAPTRPHVSWTLLGTLQRTHPAAVEAVLSDPMVSAWALRLFRRLGHGASDTGLGTPPWADAGLIGSLAAAAAIRARTRCSLRVPAHRGRLWLPSLGLTGRVARGEWPVVGVECDSRGALVHGDSGSVRLPEELSRPTEGWQPLPVLVDGMALDHLCPHRDFRALLEPGRLSPGRLSRWQRTIAEADELLRQDHPLAHRVVRGAVHSLVPVDSPGPARPVSATVPDAFGVVMMSLPEDASATAATLIHESYHQLLVAVDDLTPLLDPDRVGPEPLYFAPWREDPRPLRGLLYGAHATAGITAFWHGRRKQEGGRADFEFALHRWQLRTALATLSNAGGLSPQGGRLVAALAGQASGWWSERVAGEPGRLAARCCQDLLATWRATHLTVGPADADALARRWLAGEPPPAPLPPARLAPARLRSRLAARTWLARLWSTDRAAFDRLRADLASRTVDRWGATEMTEADAALAAGELDVAGALFGASGDPPEEPVNISDWVGIGLAGPRSEPLVERPELVVALHEALLRAGTRPPGALELARWLAPPARAGGATPARESDGPTGRNGGPAPAARSGAPA
ncbi:HEXXH motif-containing putative peptide modification protein [Streptomyces sp. NPDC004111]|uniref:aKG-HExxH-type peptide beta-hydroxylase n=1 Tax=Streptomyces sp. NPDC004111 TaxID=3364690 RepID=UPI0036A2386C